MKFLIILDHEPFYYMSINKLWMKVRPSILNLNMLNNENVCEFQAGVEQFSELQILTQHRCMMLALKKLFDLNMYFQTCTERYSA